VVIYDASGRVVRTLLDSAVPGGDVSLPWDGLDRCGRPAAAGVYFVRVEAGEAEATAKVVFLR
jgi:flagellar hook assembly protein FlgD